MSDIFEKREEGYEWKFAHDEELRFKAIARRNKMLGEWAAKKLGLTGAAGDSYAKEIVMSELADGDHDVFKRIRHDFDSKGLAVSDHEIRRTMDELLQQAIAQINASRP